jgi:hypothetical protein
MKRFAAGVVAGFILCWTASFAATGFDHNGLFWNGLSNAGKTGYVDGYNDAMRVSIGKLDSLTIAAELFHWKGARKIIHQLAKEMSTSDLTADEVVRRLDALYSNSKYSELDLGSALELLVVRNPGKINSTQPSDSSQSK